MSKTIKKVVEYQVNHYVTRSFEFEIEYESPHIFFDRFGALLNHLNLAEVES